MSQLLCWSNPCEVSLSPGQFTRLIGVMSPFHACHSTPLFFITSCPKIPNVSHLLVPNSNSIFLSRLISISLTNALIKCGVMFELYMFVPKNIVTMSVLVFNYFVFGSFVIQLGYKCLTTILPCQPQRVNVKIIKPYLHCDICSRSWKI